MLHRVHRGIDRSNEEKEIMEDKTFSPNTRRFGQWPYSTLNVEHRSQKSCFRATTRLKFNAYKGYVAQFCPVLNDQPASNVWTYFIGRQ